MVVCSELPTGEEASVTNVAEQLAVEVIRFRRGREEAGARLLAAERRGADRHGAKDRRARPTRRSPRGRPHRTGRSVGAALVEGFKFASLGAAGLAAAGVLAALLLVGGGQRAARKGTRDLS